MQKVMIAKYKGRCAVSGAVINPGDEITYDTASKKAWLVEPGDCKIETGSYLASRTRTKPGYVSDVFSMNGREFYRNKAGRCEDAPCCGCCTI
jgi:hypothetical protein